MAAGPKAAISIPPEKKRKIRDGIVVWFESNQRVLPWRIVRTPYRVWICEIMAQQTRIEALVPYFEHFMERFPTVQSLADAPLDEVLAAWSGLGYYSRARNLHKAARRIVDEHGGELPSDLEALRALPGIGAYTAGAIRSMAYDLPAPVVDGNVLRVLTRLFDIEDDITQSATRRRLTELAESLVPEQNPGQYNEGVMEFGALICTPRSPKCDVCPVRSVCAAYRKGTVELRPVRSPKREPVPVTLLAFHIVDERGRVFLLQNGDAGLFAGLWIPPMIQVQNAAIGGELYPGIKPGKRIATITHTLTHRKLTVHLHQGTIVERQPYSGQLKDGKYLEIKQIKQTYGIPTLTKKILHAAGCSTDKNEEPGKS